MQKALLILATLLVGVMSAVPAMAMSCTDHYNKCISNAPTLGWSVQETARNCNNKRMKCLNTGCWFVNREGTTKCGASKQ
jgi:hypothetical protein